MKVEARDSQYQEEHDLSSFSRDEKKMARILLRRLRFLERKASDNGGIADGGDPFVEWEIEALEWALTELGFIQENHERVGA